MNMNNAERLPIALKMVGGVTFVIGFFLIILTFTGVNIECQITSGQDFCLSRTLFGGLALGFSYFVSGWGMLKRNRLAWLFVIPTIAMAFWAFSAIYGGFLHGAGIFQEYTLLMLAPFLLHLGFLFIIIAYKRFYGFGS